MIALQITDLREFTKHLFTLDTFDAFWLSEAALQTAAALIIEGKLDPAFFAAEDTANDAAPELPAGQAPYRSWGEVRQVCFDWIRGKALPLHFRMVFRDPSRPDDAAFLNIRYERGLPLRLTTGYNAKEFTMDRSDERVWDEEVVRFLTDRSIEHEVL